MSNALLISDKILLNDLYSLNLKVYVDTNITIKDDFADACAFLEHDPEFDAIICLTTLDGKDVIHEVIEVVKKLKKKTPLILVGKSDHVKYEGNIMDLQDKLDLKGLVRTVSCSLGVTAREMAEKIVPTFYPIPSRLLKSFLKAPCDIYYQMESKEMDKKYSKIILAGEFVQGKIKKYIEEKIEYFFVDADQRLTIVNGITLNVRNRLDSNGSTTEKIEALEQGFEIIAEKFSDNPEMNEEMVSISKQCVDTMKDVISEVPKVRSLLKILLENKAGHLYSHSMLGTYVSNHIVKNISWGADEHASKIRFIFFFHDIFLAPLYKKFPNFKYEEELFFSKELTDNEKEIVLNHARLAGDFVKSFPRCPLGSDAIIRQHHGTSNGVGIAIEYKDDVSPLAKVIIVAEEFVTEMLKQVENGLRPINLEPIIEHLNTKFRKHTYKKITKTLETLKI